MAHGLIRDINAPMSKIPEGTLTELKSFFDRDVCQRATHPLRDGIEIAVFIGDSDPVTLGKLNGRTAVTVDVPAKPDMSFWTSEKGIRELIATETSDIGEIGVAILKLMAHSDPEFRLKAKVHIGLFDLLRNGYLSVLPLGGSTVMKFLGTKGFGSMGKIKDAISRMRA